MPAQESECIVQRMYREAKVSEEKGVGSTVQQDAVPQERMCSIACLYTKPTIRPRCMPCWEAYLPSRIRKLPREIDPSVPQDDTEVYSWPSFTGPWHSNIRTFAKQAKFPTACVFLWCLWGARNCQRISGSIWLDVRSTESRFDGMRQAPVSIYVSWRPGAKRSISRFPNPASFLDRACSCQVG